MAWRIHSWSSASQTGTVAAPHLGPLPFGPQENPTAKRDFALGERVLVELDGSDDAYVVRSVIAACQPQPEGTECSVLQDLNAAHPADMHVETRTDAVLRFWIGDCCERCADAWLLTFSNPQLHGLDDDMELDSPLIRLASEQECRERGLSVPPGATAYCIVTNHGAGLDGPRVFVVADGIEVELRRRRTDDKSGTH